MYSYTQLLPDTWEELATKELGYVPEFNDTNEKYVVAKTMERWKREGLTDEQIFRKWNQGNIGQCVKGINKYGVRFDSCLYTLKALNNLKS